MGSYFTNLARRSGPLKPSAVRGGRWDRTDVLTVIDDVTYAPAPRGRRPMSSVNSQSNSGVSVRSAGAPADIGGDVPGDVSMRGEHAEIRTVVTVSDAKIASEPGDPHIERAKEERHERVSPPTVLDKHDDTPPLDKTPRATDSRSPPMGRQTKQVSLPSAGNAVIDKVSDRVPNDESDLPTTSRSPRTEMPETSAASEYRERVKAPTVAKDKKVLTTSPRSLPAKPVWSRERPASNGQSRSINVRIGSVDVEVRQPAPPAPPAVRRLTSATSIQPRNVLRRHYLREV